MHLCMPSRHNKSTVVICVHVIMYTPTQQKGELKPGHCAWPLALMLSMPEQQQMLLSYETLYTCMNSLLY